LETAEVNCLAKEEKEILLRHYLNTDLNNLSLAFSESHRLNCTHSSLLEDADYPLLYQGEVLR
jgi:hypothetical protein